MAVDYWREPMPLEVAQARDPEHFAYAVERGPGYCAGRAAGAWDANLAESFGFYHAAKREAERLAAAN